VTVNWYAQRYSAKVRKPQKELTEEEGKRQNLKEILGSDEDKPLEEVQKKYGAQPSAKRHGSESEEGEIAKNEFDQRNADIQMYKNVFKALGGYECVLGGKNKKD
jgi:ribosomal protein L14E/L6E/L27E